MSVTPDQPAPYAPASVIIDLVERHRNKGLPVPVDADVLARAGVSDSLIPRTLYSLQCLDLIDSDKKPTPVLEGMRLAPESEFKAKMLEWLQGAYADALQFVDPAKDDETAIRDAFRNYKPIGQQSRMVTLFSGLFRAAGIGLEKASAPIIRKKGLPRPVPKGAVANSRGGGVGRAVGEKAASRRDLPPPAPLGGGLPPALAGLLTSLPDPSVGWTKADRDSFVATFGVVLDFCFPPGLKPTEAAGASSDENGDDQ